MTTITHSDGTRAPHTAHGVDATLSKPIRQMPPGSFQDRASAKLMAGAGWLPDRLRV